MAWVLKHEIDFVTQRLVREGLIFFHLILISFHRNHLLLQTWLLKHVLKPGQKLFSLKKFCFYELFKELFPGGLLESGFFDFQIIEPTAKKVVRSIFCFFEILPPMVL